MGNNVTVLVYNYPIPYCNRLSFTFSYAIYELYYLESQDEVGSLPNIDISMAASTIELMVLVVDAIRVVNLLVGVVTISVTISPKESTPFVLVTTMGNGISRNGEDPSWSMGFVYNLMVVRMVTCLQVGW